VKPYLIRLVNAVISGIAIGVATSPIFPGSSIFQVLAAMGISAGVSAAKWFLQHPIPGASNGQA
jgi:hypothetical protein